MYKNRGGLSNGISWLAFHVDEDAPEHFMKIFREMSGFSDQGSDFFPLRMPKSR